MGNSKIIINVKKVYKIGLGLMLQMLCLFLGTGFFKLTLFIFFMYYLFIL